MFDSYIHELARSAVTTAVAAGMWERSNFYIKLAFGWLYFSRTVKTAHLRAVGANVASQLEQLAHRE